MSDPSGLLLALLLVTGAVVLALVQRHHVARVRTDRGRLFEDCSGLLDDAEVIPRGLNFPLLAGRRSGHPVRVEPVIDTLSMRTLPVLWLVVTVAGPRVDTGRLSVLARACGTEFYARHDEASDTVLMGPAWPGDLAVRADSPETASQQAGLLEDIRQLMTDQRVKQVVVGPESARVVWRCATADSATYRATRRVDITGARADAPALATVLDAIEELLGERGAVTASVGFEQSAASQ
jgi:hypothetical protein